MLTTMGSKDFGQDEDHQHRLVMFMPFRRESSPKIISELGLSSMSSLIPDSEPKPRSRLPSSSTNKPRRVSSEENNPELYLKNRNRSGSALISMMLPSGTTDSDEDRSLGSALASGQRRPSIVNPGERALTALELKRNRSLLESSGAADDGKSSSEGIACVDFSGPLPEKLIRIKDHLQCDVSVKLSYDSDLVNEKLQQLALHVQKLESLKSQIHDQMYAFQSDTRYTQKDTDQQLDRIKAAQQDFDAIEELHFRMEKSREKIDQHRQRLSNVASLVVELEKEDHEQQLRVRFMKILIFSVALAALVLSAIVSNTDCPRAMSALLSHIGIKKMDPIERLQQTSELPIISI